jgi:hypothetical protein
MNELEKLFEEPKAPEPVSEEELRKRYVEQMNALADDANDRGMLPLLVGVATWKLAAIASACGPVAAGDVVRQLGNHMHAIAVRERAQREADKARAEGRLPH